MAVITRRSVALSRWTYARGGRDEPYSRAQNARVPYGGSDDPRCLTRAQLLNRCVWYRAYGEPRRAWALAGAWLQVPAAERTWDE